MSQEGLLLLVTTDLWWGAGWSWLCGNPWDIGVLSTLQDWGLCWSLQAWSGWKTRSTCVVETLSSQMNSHVWGATKKYTFLAIMLASMQVHGDFWGLFSSPGQFALPSYAQRCSESRNNQDWATCARTVGTARKQVHGTNVERLLQLWKSTSKSDQWKPLPSERLLTGHFRGKYFCLAFICFFSSCTSVQGFICLPHWISDFIYSSCSFPTWHCISKTVASPPVYIHAIGNVLASRSNMKISAGEQADAPGLILNNNELIFVDLPLVLIKSRKYGTCWQNNLKTECS